MKLNVVVVSELVFFKGNMEEGVPNAFINLCDEYYRSRVEAVVEVITCRCCDDNFGLLSLRNLE